MIHHTAQWKLGSTGALRECHQKDFQFWGNRWVVPLRKSLIAAILTFLATFNGPTVPAFAHQVPVRVMTRNMYLGADIRPLLAATTPAEFVAALTQIYQSILATKTAERAAAVAREIVTERADVVALQEVWILRTGSAPATDVKSDQLEALLGELRRLGQPYEAVAILPNTDFQAPTSLGFDARLTDRTVIIARAGVSGPPLKLANMRVQDYLANRVVNTPVGVPLISKRGWASVDVTVSGHSFRLVNTHLDVTHPFLIQRAQALEAIRSATNTALPIVFLGDFNASGDIPNPPNITLPTYELIINAGFSDAWKQRFPTLPGLTCCQAADLLNPTSTLQVRIDLVFTRGAVSVEDIELVGDRTSDRTPSGLWPSDHAGLSATLRIAE